MPVSPARDIAGLAAGLLLIVVAPYAISTVIFPVTTIPVAEGVTLNVTSGDLGHTYFISLLGMSNAWFGLLSTQLGIAGVLSPMFDVINTDWMILSFAAFIATGGIAAFVLKTDLERGVVPLAVGVFAMLIGVLFTEGFVRGISGLENFAAIGISNAVNLIVVVSYGAGALLSGLVSLVLGRLVFGRAPTVAEPVEAPKAAKPAEEGKEPAKIPQAVAVPEAEIKEAGPPKAAAELAKPEEPQAAAREEVRPISASEIAKGPETAVEAERIEGAGVEEPPPSQIEETMVGPKPAQPPPARREPYGRLERRRTAKELFRTLEEPLERISTRVEREPGAVWRPIPCPMCGSELSWSRDQQAYFCPVCGTVP